MAKYECDIKARISKEQQAKLNFMQEYYRHEYEADTIRLIIDHQYDVTQRKRWFSWFRHH